MRLFVDCECETASDIGIRTRAEVNSGGILMDIFGRGQAVAQPIAVAQWTFVIVPVGYTGPLGFLSELTAPIVVTYSRDAVEAIPEFSDETYKVNRVWPYLVITPGAAVWEISQEFERLPRLLRGDGAPTDRRVFDISRGGICAEFAIGRGITYVDSRGAALLAGVLPHFTKTEKWLAGKTVAWAGVIAEHIDATRLTAAAESLERLSRELASAGAGGKSILEREALLERRDILLTALESYDAELRTIRVPVVRASAAELSRALVAAPVAKPAVPVPASFTIEPAAARARIDEIATLLAAPAPIIPPVVTAPRLIDVAAFEPAARAAAERYNETLRGEIARAEARAADAKAARAEHSRRIALEAEAAKLRAGLASLESAAQWARYREWKKTAGVTAAEYEAAVAAERAAARLDELVRARAEHLRELLLIEREIGANKAAVSSDEYQGKYKAYFDAVEEHRAATKEYRARAFFKTESSPENDRAQKAIGLAGLTRVEFVVLRAAPGAELLAELARVVPHVIIVDYRGANWFLPTRDAPAGPYLGRLVPPPVVAPVLCACGKTYKNARKHFESRAHKKWVLMQRQ